MPRTSISQRYRDLPFSGKMNLLITVSVVVPMVVLVGLYTTIARRITIDSAIEAEVRNLEYVVGNLESLREQADALSQIIVTDAFLQEVASRTTPVNESELFDEEFALRAILDRVVQRQSTVRSAYVRLWDGRLFRSTQIDISRLGADVRESERLGSLFSQAEPGPAIMPTRLNRFEIGTDVSYSLALARQLVSIESGASVGVVVLNVDARDVGRMLSGASDGAEFPTFLIDQSGSILASTAGAVPGTLLDDLVSPTDRAERRTDAQIVQFAGVSSLSIDIPLREIGWSLVRFAPLRDVLQPTRYVNLIVLGVGLLCLILAVLFSYPITHSLTHRVRDLIDAMDLAGQGDLETRVAVDAADEIGQVSEYFNTMVERVSGLMADVYEEQRDKRRFELMALQAQIRPHFLYNALDGVCALTQMGRNEDAFTMAKALSLFYRGALSQGRNIITLGEELDIVEQYLTIQSMRYPGKFSYQILVPDWMRDRPTLKLLLQPLVENSIYHGFRGTDKHGKITIRASAYEEFYEVTVLDNGRGGDEQPGRGFGLGSVRDRARLYFGPRAEVTFDGTPGATRVTVRLPYEERDGER